jgi:hypothetical protein
MVKRRFDEHTVSMANGAATQLAGGSARRKGVIIGSPVGVASATLLISFKGSATASVGVPIVQGQPAYYFSEEEFGDLVHQPISGFVTGAGVTVTVVEVMEQP